MSPDSNPDHNWPDNLGPLQRRDRRTGGNTDDDCFTWTALDQVVEPEFLDRYVVWDSPDLTTKDAVVYEDRVLEIAGMAPVVVYVASDERYNDDLPTRALQMLLAAGKRVVVVLTKVNEWEAADLEALFREQVLGRLEHTQRIADIICIPQAPPQRAGDLWHPDFPFGTMLRRAVYGASGPGFEIRGMARDAAAIFLRQRLDGITAPLTHDLTEWHAWGELIHTKLNEAVTQYEKDFIRRYHRHDLAGVSDRLLSLLIPTGPMHHAWRVFEICRLPYRFATSFFQTRSQREDEDYQGQQALDRARHGLIDSLQLTVSQWRDRHRVWAELHQRMDERVRDTIEPVYIRERHRQQAALEQEVQHTLRQVYEGVAAQPTVVNTLRGVRIALDVVVTVGILVYWVSGSISLGLALILFLVGMGVVEALSQALAEQYVHHFRELLIQQHRNSIRSLLERTYVERLLALPTSEGQQLSALAQMRQRLEHALAALGAPDDRRRMLPTMSPLPIDEENAA